VEVRRLRAGAETRRPEVAEVDHRSVAAEALAAVLCHDLAGAEEHSGRVAAEALELEP
jgi:hypothetical protein